MASLPLPEEAPPQDLARAEAEGYLLSDDPLWHLVEPQDEPVDRLYDEEEASPPPVAGSF